MSQDRCVFSVITSQTPLPRFETTASRAMLNGAGFKETQDVVPDSVIRETGLGAENSVGQVNGMRWAGVSGGRWGPGPADGAGRESWDPRRRKGHTRQKRSVIFRGKQETTVCRRLRFPKWGALEVWL